jgi:hypothetical protein
MVESSLGFNIFKAKLLLTNFLDGLLQKEVEFGLLPWVFSKFLDIL